MKSIQVSGTVSNYSSDSTRLFGAAGLDGLRTVRVRLLSPPTTFSRQSCLARYT